MATSFRCGASCQAGLLLRLEKTADGFKGVFVSISDTPGAFPSRSISRGVSGRRSRWSVAAERSDPSYRRSLRHRPPA